jgi:hypothetical protein
MIDGIEPALSHAGLRNVGCAFMQNRNVLFTAALLISGPCMATSPAPADPVYQPGIVSTAAAEVRIAFSPDGKRMLWGSIGRDAPADQQDIWETHRTANGWAAPARVSFDTDAVEFDPAFSADGRQVYFHSDRPGGFGGTDLYVADLDSASGRFSAPRNLGKGVNSRGDEWAPTPTQSGTLIFASDGWGGFGKHDLFEVPLRADGDGDGKPPRNLGGNINGPEEDFDAALTSDGRTLVFSSGRMSDDDAQVALYRSRREKKSWSAREPLGTGCSTFVIGTSIDSRDPQYFYYAANCAGGQGRMDMRRAAMPR